MVAPPVKYRHRAVVDHGRLRLGRRFFEVKHHGDSFSDSALIPEVKSMPIVSKASPGEIVCKHPPDYPQRGIFEPALA